MQNAKNSKTRWFVISFLLSILFVLGVVGIPVCASNGMTALMIVSIVFTVLGFYCMPMSWIAFAMRCSTVKVGKAILNEEIYEVKALEQRLKMNLLDIEKHIDRLLYWEALPGLKYDGNLMKLVSAVEEKESKRWTQQCQSCGAKVEGTGVKTTCPYCGWSLTKDN